ncbi:hypothetical protein Z947_2907 [Sulfitobacter geojensis]|nr:hypothetical protein Z947_2907 [Sulfitobacter geojensis]
MKGVTARSASDTHIVCPLGHGSSGFYSAYTMLHLVFKKRK